MRDSNSYAAVLRGAVRGHYGNRSEKLAEFGLQPLRFRQRSAAGDNPLPQPEQTLHRGDVPSARPFLGLLRERSPSWISSTLAA